MVFASVTFSLATLALPRNGFTSCTLKPADMPKRPHTPSLAPPTSAELKQFRDAIDAMDNRIIQILKDRAAIVQQVGEMKRSRGAPACFIRAGREAEMVRRIYKTFSGHPFAAASAAAIWRLVIGASTNIESPMRISVRADDTDDKLYWMAREYFGPCVTIIRQPNVNRVVGDVVDGKAEVGLLPPVQDETHGNWWQTLSQQEKHHAPRVFAHVPFVASKSESQRRTSFAIAKIEPEATDEDITLLTVHTSDISIQRLITAFATAGFKASRIHSHNDPHGTVLHLLEVQGFVAHDEPKLKSIWNMLGEGLHGWHWVGAYATPILTRETC